MIYKKFGKHACVLSKDFNKLGLEWSELKNALGEMCNSQKEMCQLLKEILKSQKEIPQLQKEVLNSLKEMSNSQKEMSNSQKEISNSQKEMCQLLKEVLNCSKEICHSQEKMLTSQKEMSNSQKEMLNSQTEVLHSVQGQHNVPVLPQAAAPNVGTCVMVIGGRNLNSVEVLYLGSKVWKVLPPMQELRGSAALALHTNDVIISGGRSNGGISDTIEQLSLVKKPLTWIPFPVKLPFISCGHKSVVILMTVFI